jgi:hypothetical protein
MIRQTAVAFSMVLALVFAPSVGHGDEESPSPPPWERGISPEKRAAANCPVTILLGTNRRLSGPKDWSTGAHSIWVR